MSQYILYISPKDKVEDLPWPIDLSAQGVCLLHAHSVHEGLYYCRAYHLIMILVEIDRVDDLLRQDLATITNAASSDHQALVVGLTECPLSEKDRQELAEAGLDDLVAQSEPERFVRRRLEILLALSDLQRFEQARMDVMKLASATRKHLHDLSQPLSAVQGRLQLLAARCPSDDPNIQTFQDLVRLIFEVTHQLMEMQQIHRQF